MPSRIDHQVVEGVECAHCASCGQFKPLEQFSKTRSRWDGLANVCKGCARSWYKEHPKEVLTCRRRHYEAHREEAIAYARQWQKEHPEESRVIAYRAGRKRRAAARGGLHEPYDALEIYTRDCGLCGICGGAVSKRCFVLDHFWPLSKGGSDTKDNVRIAHSLCNLEKGSRVPTEEEVRAWLDKVRSWDLSEILLKKGEMLCPC